jgi:asparagine synthase (glutamine-hydrolysing)
VGITIVCGIAGFFLEPCGGSRELLQSLNNSQRHRGPDNEGIWISADCQVGFAHRRLSIVDLTPTGAQPMHSASGRFVTTFNGEIYNFCEMRDDLKARGHKFAGTSDTEVMLATFEQWGVEAGIQRLNGMFAAAVWDQADERLYLFRDRLGVKPLYYQWGKRGLFFSSELTRPFAAMHSRFIDRNALAAYIRHGFVPAPQTIFSGIYKLAPGTLAIATRPSCDQETFAREYKYWDAVAEVNSAIATRVPALPFEDAVNLLNSALSESVRQHVIADVPLGAFLSGGIDSSLVVSHMQAVSSRPVKTFTIGFDDPTANEAGFAREIANHLQTEHTEFYISERVALDVVPEMPAIYGEPFADSSQIPTYLVSKLARSAVTVALSGDGGDELFAGYNSYQRAARHHRAAMCLPSWSPHAAALSLAVPVVRDALRAVGGDRSYARLSNAVAMLAPDASPAVQRGVASGLLSERLVKESTPGASLLSCLRCAGNPIEQAQCHDTLTYLPDDILVKVDRASMAVSLEVRAPFVDDVNLFRVAWQIPFEHKIKNETGKAVLKEALATFVPRTLFERPKKGFSVPLVRWLRGALNPWVKDSISPSRIAREGYFDPVLTQRVYERAIAGDEYYAQHLWCVCIFQTWLSSRSVVPDCAAMH